MKKEMLIPSCVLFAVLGGKPSLSKSERVEELGCEQLTLCMYAALAERRQLGYNVRQPLSTQPPAMQQCLVQQSQILMVNPSYTG